MKEESNKQSTIKVDKGARITYPTSTEKDNIPGIPGIRKLGSLRTS